MRSSIDALEQSFNLAARDAFRGFVTASRPYADFSAALDCTSATDALRSILRTTADANTPPVHIIIDEYDNFTNQLLTTHQDSLYSELTTGDSFLRAFFKVIKAGVGEGTIARVFITGVLPVTMDDLTSGFNIGQIPAQAFDKANENFFRTTFFELCARYLSQDFMFAIEVNRSTGRSDWEATGRAGTPFENQAALIEFKQYTKETAAKLGVLDWTEPPADAVEQVTAYAADLQRDYPDLTITRHVVCTIRAADYRFFDLT